MRCSKILVFVILFSIYSFADSFYKRSSQVYTIDYISGSWDGKLSFPNVYCSTIPLSKTVKTVEQSMYNNNAIYLARILYTNNTILTIVFSSIPMQQTTEYALDKVLQNEKNNANTLQKNNQFYKVSELETAFGKTVGIVAKNLSEFDPSTKDPFPLSRAIASDANQSLHTVSVHRLFARGHDRFEVAAIQLASQPITNTTESDMTTHLISLVENTVTSLQACTGMMPLRIPK